MTKTCVVCKKYPISGDTTRSFHKFPVNEDIKKQWMEATGISKINVNCTVCSDHFTADSYHQTDIHTSVKRLVKNAVPNVKKNEANTKEASPESGKVKENGDKEIDNSSQLSERTTPNAISENDNGLNDNDDQNISDGNTSHPDNEKIEMSTALKRKSSSTQLTSELSMKRMFRFRDGVETKYLSRDEFVSEEAWEKFLTLMLLNKRRVEALRSKIARTRRSGDCGSPCEPVMPQDQSLTPDFGPEKFLEVILQE